MGARGPATDPLCGVREGAEEPPANPLTRDKPVTTDIGTGEGDGERPLDKRIRECSYEGLPARDIDRIPRALRARLPAAERLALEFAASKQSPRTRRGYAADLDDYFRWLRVEGLEALEATRGDVEAYMRHLQSRDQGERTRARKLAAVRGLYERGVDEGLIASSPARRVRSPKVSKEPAGKALSEAELRQLATEARRAGPQAELLVVLLGVCGLRISEACAAKLEHLRSDGEGGLALRILGKGRKAREVPLPPIAAQLIGEVAAGRSSGHLLRRRYSEHYRRRMGGHRSLPPLGPMSQQYAWDRLQVLAARAGLVEGEGDRGAHATVHPHMLRHSYTTLALDKGVPLARVQDSLGHSSPETTRRYDRRRDRDRDSPAQAVADIIRLDPSLGKR